MKRFSLLSAALIGLLMVGIVAGRDLRGPGPSSASAQMNGSWSCGMSGGPWGDWDHMWGESGQMGSGMMMGDWNASGGMWGMMGNMGMMGSYSANATPITDAEAQQRLTDFAAQCGSDVTVGEVMSFSSNYYAQLVDGNGAGLLEVLVDRYTGVVYPEPGPNMMWNDQWGVNAGANGATQYDQAAAQELASTFLMTYLPTATVLDGSAFPGYYTFDFGRTQVEGMLSVNAATGEIWAHTWHGPALDETT